jgi:hypothetical protein
LGGTDLKMDELAGLVQKVQSAILYRLCAGISFVRMAYGPEETDLPIRFGWFPPAMK